MDFHRWILVAVAVTASSLAGCSKDEDVLAFIKANDALASDIKAAPNGIAAKGVFEQKKGNLKAKFDAAKGARGFQVKKENMEALTKSVTDSTMTICMLKLRGNDYASLCDDYTKMLK